MAGLSVRMRQIDGKAVTAAANGSLSDRDLKKVVWSLATARQALLSPDAIREKADDPTPSEKLATAASEIIRQPLPALAFSNFLAFGAKPLHALLGKLGVKCQLIHGGIPQRKREESLGRFRAGGTDVLVLAPVGGEGLDLPGVGSVHLVDPHWNPEATRQMIGRARRIGSGQRNVAAFHYRAVGPNGEPTVDDVIDAVALRKNRINGVVRDIVAGKIAGDEPILFKKRD